jgi:hypothetical protein
MSGQTPQAVDAPRLFSIGSTRARSEVLIYIGPGMQKNSAAPPADSDPEVIRHPHEQYWSDEVRKSFVP